MTNYSLTQQFNTCAADYLMSLGCKFKFVFNEDFNLGLSFLKHFIVRIDHLIS